MIGRLLVEKMENRILVGILMFVGTMLMVGWVAINENARMASFTQQYEARSVERGAELFAANCSTCHGNDGRGIGAYAPALNNPHLFGYDPIAEVRTRLDDGLEQQTTLQDERAMLTSELEAEEGVTEERRAEIDARIAEIDELLAPEAELAQNIAAAQQEYDTYLTTITTAIDNGYDPEAPSRIAQANWPGTLEAYIYTTLIHGRAQNAPLWGGNIMSPWSQRAGGPLRDDQIQDIVSYIMNWDKGDDWTAEDLLAVNQFARVPGQEAGGEVTADAAGTDVNAILAAWTEQGIVGDPVRGESLYNNRERSQRGVRLGCAGCHEGGINGPPTEGKWDRVVNERLTLPEFEGYTPEQYLVESIVAPSAYIVPGYNDIMPKEFGEQTSLQDLADIVAYINTTSASYVPPADTGEETTDIDTTGGGTDGEIQEGANMEATTEGAQQAP